MKLDSSTDCLSVQGFYSQSTTLPLDMLSSILLMSEQSRVQTLEQEPGFFTQN
jgi:hypothetical protein